MDTTQETTGQAPETGKMKRARLVRLGWKLLPIFGALLLSGGMLAAWFTGMAWASSIDQENFPEILQAAASYTIIKSTNFSTFSIGPASKTGNQYIITVKSSTVTSIGAVKSNGFTSHGNNDK